MSQAHYPAQELRDITGVGEQLEADLIENGIDTVEKFRQNALGEDVDGVRRHFDAVWHVADRFKREACADVGMLYTECEMNASASEFSAEKVDELRVIGYGDLIETLVEETSLSWDAYDVPSENPYVDDADEIVEQATVGDRLSTHHERLDATVLGVNRELGRITAKLDDDHIYGGVELTFARSYRGWKVIDQPDDLKDLSRYSQTLVLLPCENDMVQDELDAFEEIDYGQKECFAGLPDDVIAMMNEDMNARRRESYERDVLSGNVA